MKAALPHLAEFLAVKLAKHGPVQHVSGLCPGARVLGVELVLAGVEKALVVVPSPHDAQELVASYALLFPECKAALLPAETLMPFTSAPLGATAEAVAALLAWQENQVSRLVVPARLLPLPFPEPEEVAKRCLLFRPGQALNPSVVAAVLTREGFRRVDVVEEAGEFAVRGEVLDLGTPAGFFRFLLDVDTVERIREFDPQSQRSTKEILSARIQPLTLFPSHPENRSKAAQSLRKLGCQELAKKLENGPLDGALEAFLALGAPRLPLWTLAPSVVVEPEAVWGELALTWATVERQRTVYDEVVPLPEPEDWLYSPEVVKRELAGKPTVAELTTRHHDQSLHLHTQPSPAVASRPQLLVEALRGGLALRYSQVLVAASKGEEERLAHLLQDHDIPFSFGFPSEGGVGIVQGQQGKGFSWPEARLTLFGRQDLTSLSRSPSRSRTLARVLFDLRDLQPGDYVVHVDHGIGRFLGFCSVTVNGTAHECLELEYARGAKLLVPMERADLLEKYASAEAAPPRLDHLGGNTWKATKARVKRALKDLAQELLHIAAMRELTPGYAFSKDGPWQKEFEAAFEWELTPDQEQAVAEVKRDMESPRPMDRLLVGDVGYGKTEVAMRATFKAVMDGKQVCVLAPTTILAEQHFRTFTRRFTGFPVEIRMLSRFLPLGEQKKVVKGLAEGLVDVVIGTHRLLAKDVTFRDLGLLIIDEEQRFGVAHKERLKKLKANVDVLSMSATPIPRTLNLGLLGLRDVSIIETPPRDRLAVQTHVVPFDPEIIREAANLELSRGGQVFFVHNRVASLPVMAKFLRELLPEARVVVAHGQMAEHELAAAMEAFFEKRADILLSTAIVENGLDVPNANTLIVNRADRFGLAQLYQLRGRVGRSDRLAFAFFLVPKDEALSSQARARLASILEFAELGAGFRVAARDLEIRGAGSILGAEQHGHLQAVGYETYLRLLEEATAELRGQPLPEPTPAVEVELGLPVRIPESYVPQETLRLALYRRIAAVKNLEELAQALEEISDRFGPPPKEIYNLSLVQRLRLASQPLGIRRLRRRTGGLEIQLDPQHPQAHALVMRLVQRFPETRVEPNGHVQVLRSVEVEELGELLLAASLA
ncbi:MAG: transcription-repair coupling factor [Thermoanaerobaculaceae bacterium]